MRSDKLRLVQVLFITLFLTISHTTKGTIITEDVVGVQYWRLSDSPFEIPENDLVISPEAKLILDPGVHVYIGPGLAIRVKGILIARGLKDNRIVFTSLWKKQNVSGSKGTPSINSFWSPRERRRSEIRLVGGEETRQGQLQVWLNNFWRPVCSQNTQWTAVDCRTVCRQLGFADGNFTLGPLAANYTPGVEIVAPGCHGNEPVAWEQGKTTDRLGPPLGLFACPGFKANKSFGRTVCRECWKI